jgi:adenine/guanine phosphoribosyltransferase-like PRPP-binding protein
MAMGAVIAYRLGLDIETSVIQENTAGHTGALGRHRLANPAIFSGEVTPGGVHLLVDDFIGQGGTVANLAGFIESKGAECSA